MNIAMAYAKGWHDWRLKPSGKWEARWADESGAARGKCFLTETQAKRYAFDRAKEILDAAVGLASPSKSLEEAARTFLGEYADGGTVAIYERHLDNFMTAHPTITRTGQLTTALFKAYDVTLSRDGRNPGGRRHVLKTLKVFTRYLVRNKWLGADPFFEYKLPKSEFEGRALVPAEIAALEAIDARYDCDWWINRAVRLARSTMRRSSQVWGITPRDFREPGLLYVGSIKGQGTEWVPLQPEAAAIVRELLARPDRPAPDARLFWKWSSADAMRQAFRGKATRAGLKGVRLHDAGKVTRVTELDAAGKGLGYIAAVSGTSQATLSRYYIKPDRRAAFADYQTYGGPTQGPNTTEKAPQAPTTPNKGDDEYATTDAQMRGV